MVFNFHIYGSLFISSRYATSEFCVPSSSSSSCFPYVPPKPTTAETNIQCSLFLSLAGSRSSSSSILENLSWGGVRGLMVTQHSAPVSVYWCEPLYP